MDDRPRHLRPLVPWRARQYRDRHTGWAVSQRSRERSLHPPFALPCRALSRSPRVDDREPSTGLLRAVDIIEEESMELSVDEDDILDESLELGLEDIEDSVDWGRSGGVSLSVATKQNKKMVS